MPGLELMSFPSTPAIGGPTKELFKGKIHPFCNSILVWLIKRINFWIMIEGGIIWRQEGVCTQTWTDQWPWTEG